MTTAVPAEIPSPTTAVWWLGPVPLRAYALCILAGIVVAVWSTRRRLQASTGRGAAVLDVSAWAVPFGIVGGRLYHVITTPQPYFGEGGNPWHALRIWEGGLGIWGAIALGALGAWFGCRRVGVPLADFCDAAAPGVAVAQAMGRFGNWFNNEIHGSPTDLPWGLRVYVWDQPAGRAVVDADGQPIVKGIFQPTFLYEALWCLALAGFLLWWSRRRAHRGRALRPGQVFAAYVMGYPVGRVVIELMRTDEANLVLGLRVNVWVSALVFLLGWWLMHRARSAGPGPERPDDEADAVPTDTAPSRHSG